MTPLRADALPGRSEIAVGSRRSVGIPLSRTWACVGRYPPNRRQLPQWKELGVEPSPRLRELLVSWKCSPSAPMAQI